MTPEVTRGTLLAGRVRYAQLAGGYRTGIEPVLLAAAVPARDGQRVIEAGCGAGAGLLCLAARVPGAGGVGVELDRGLAALASDNARENGWTERLCFVAAAIEDYARAPAERFDHAMANPPWHDPAGSVSPDPGRAAAKRAPAGLLNGWIAALAKLLAPRGTLSLMLSAANLEEAMAALPTCGVGSIRLMPFWPRAGREARMALVQAVRGGQGATRLLPGLQLHAGAGYSAAATRVLEDGVGLWAAGPE